MMQNSGSIMEEIYEEEDAFYVSMDGMEWEMIRCIWIRRDLIPWSFSSRVFLVSFFFSLLAVEPLAHCLRRMERFYALRHKQWPVRRCKVG